MLNCIVRHQTCPIGARCTITTKVSWFDADAHLNWGASAESTVRNIYALDPWSFLPVRWKDAYTWNPYGWVPHTWEMCTTGFDGDRCFATASLEVLGEGRPLLSACQLSVGNQLWYRNFVNAAADVVLRTIDNSLRRIECGAEWHVYPAPELAAAPAGKACR